MHLSSFISSYLFTDYLMTVGISNRMSNDKWIMNQKGCGRKWLWINLRYYLRICLERQKKTMKTSVRIAGVLAWDSVWTPPEFKSKVLSPEPTCLVWNISILLNDIHNSSKTESPHKCTSNLCATTQDNSMILHKQTPHISVESTSSYVS
jgi:hypothetical protein